LRLSSLDEVTAIPLEDLPPFERAALEGTITVDDAAEARARVTDLERTAAACRAQRSMGIPCGSGNS
ncbi:MAG: serine/threonine-protein phosphatase, partial [Mobilicoccus sp.]|nr:serine/threonine-protein phosphatase [Mobilicoccus sp.]